MKEEFLVTDPEKFMLELSKQPDYLSLDMARYLDSIDPFRYTGKMFHIGKLIPLAGHSLGPAFNPTLKKIQGTHELQKKLHAGHFVSSHPEGQDSGHWFDCDRHKPSLIAAQEILGFKEFDEFNFTASGLSENLARLMETFFRPGLKDWRTGKTKIVMLATEFFSDQAVAMSVMIRAIKTAEGYDVFKQCIKPNPADEILKIPANENGIYKTHEIIDFIKSNAKKIKMICLPDIVFSTGQRLELDIILFMLRSILQENNIHVILDLAHTVGNRAINLEALQVTAAVGCGYKHLCGYAGSGFGIYVNRNVNLEEHPPLQGWKAADPTKVFALINNYDDKIMDRRAGATAFRISNPPPVSLAPVQSFLTVFGIIGFEKLFNKSECLTRYLLALLKHHLNDQIEIITPQQTQQRGATICFKIKGAADVNIIEEDLKKSGYEIDTRPPNIIRVTAHYGYTQFQQLNTFVSSFKCILDDQAHHRISQNPETIFRNTKNRQPQTTEAETLRSHL